MRYTVAAKTDVGIRKKVNQDSVLVKHALIDQNEVLLAIVCDGMGGLKKGELASAEVVRFFNQWFLNELSNELEYADMNIISEKWRILLAELDRELKAYGQKMDQKTGTTFTGILFINEQYLIGHVGDSRVYHIDHSCLQLTEDHTFIQYQINKGEMTLEQAKTDPRRNMLMQTVGATKRMNPQFISGRAKKGHYLICSDGFRHKITPMEITQIFAKQTDKAGMALALEKTIDLIKQRNERDNISAILINVE